MAERSKRSKRIGRILVAVGLALIIGAAGIFVYNTITERRAIKVERQAVADLEDSLAQQPESDMELKDLRDVEMPTRDIDGILYIGKLEIPSIDQKFPIISEWSNSNLLIAPCRYSGTAYKDNMVIAGHNYPRSYGKIIDLNAKDEVVFTDVWNNRFEYEVQEIVELKPTAVEEMVEGEGWDLTLFTCNYSGQARLAVRCQLRDIAQKKE